MWSCFVFVCLRLDFVLCSNPRDVISNFIQSGEHCIKVTLDHFSFFNLSNVASRLFQIVAWVL